jgi:hypothetical protein
MKRPPECCAVNEPHALIEEGNDDVNSEGQDFFGKARYREIDCIAV